MIVLNAIGLFVCVAVLQLLYYEFGCIATRDKSCSAFVTLLLTDIVLVALLLGKLGL